MKVLTTDFLWGDPGLGSSRFQGRWTEVVAYHNRRKEDWAWAWRQNINSEFHCRAVHQQWAWLPRPSGLCPCSSLFQSGCIQIAGVKTILAESARATDTEHSAHEVRKAKCWTTWLSLKKNPHTARPLGTSGSRFGSHCAFPTQKECMKSHQPLTTLLSPQGCSCPQWSPRTSLAIPSFLEAAFCTKIQSSFKVNLIILLYKKKLNDLPII